MAAETHRSICPLDCPDACSLEVKVEGGRVVGVDGLARNPLTAGYICAKVRRFPEHLYGPDRILHPAVRDGRKGAGAFRDVSWDEALDRDRRSAAPRRASGSGGEAILPFCYGGSNGCLTQDALRRAPLPPARRVAPGAHGLRGADRRAAARPLRQDARRRARRTTRTRG